VNRQRMGDGGWCSGTAVYERWILVNRLRGWEMGGGALGQLCIRDAKYLRRVTQEFNSLVS